MCPRAVFKTPAPPVILRGGTVMSDDAGDHELLLGRALGGDCGALAELFERHRGRLEHMV